MTLPQTRTLITLTGLGFIGGFLAVFESPAFGLLVFASLSLGCCVGYFQCKLDEQWRRGQ